MKKTYPLLISLFILMVGIAGSVAAQDTGPQLPDAVQAELAAQSASPQAVEAQLGTAFTYQGNLRKANGPVNGACDMTFRLFDAATAGNPIGNAVSLSVPVANGVFTAGLDFGGAAFNGEARWLEIGVKCAGDAAFTTLSPRHSITPAPYALALPGLRTEQNAFDFSPNVIGGSPSNRVAAGAVGAVIGGGGVALNSNIYINEVWANYGVVGGGRGNKVFSFDTTISGGIGNTAGGDGSTVGGGGGNKANGRYATIPGGSAALASHYGEMAYASGSFFDAGDAQTSVYVLGAVVPSNQTFKELFLGISHARLTIGSGRALAFNILIVARSDNAESSGWRFEGVIENDSGAVRFIGTPVKTILGEDDPIWDVGLVADDANDALVIKGFSNSSGDTIRFVATVRTVEVAW